MKVSIFRESKLKVLIFVFRVRPDAAAPPHADVGDNGGDAADHFLPLEDNNMELDQNLEEHVDRHQVFIFIIIIVLSVFTSSRLSSRFHVCLHVVLFVSVRLQMKDG